eukprot:5687092-Amphidinium_carterae.5
MFQEYWVIQDRLGTASWDVSAGIASVLQLWGLIYLCGCDERVVRLGLDGPYQGELYCPFRQGDKPVRQQSYIIYDSICIGDVECLGYLWAHPHLL